FFPYATSDEQVLMVQGTGSASATAETAEIELVFTSYNPYYDPYTCSATADSSTEPMADAASDTVPGAEPPSVECPPPEVTPITRSTLQPAIDALTQAGIPASAVEVRLPSDETTASPYSAYYYPDSASISVDLAQPTQERVQQLMTSVEDAVSNQENLYLQDRYVKYTLSQTGCDRLEQEAYRAAIGDARDRATVLASALEVELGNVPSVADSIFSSMMSSVFSPYPSYCDTSLTAASTPYPPSPAYYDPALPAEVQVQRAVFVTYPIVRQ
ncbi:MAG TPA: SIMPL domain-containing protein, partial [Allocoleopsis sp.]